MRTIKMTVVVLFSFNLAPALWAGDTDVDYVSVEKTRDLIQTSTANPVNGAIPFSFGIEVEDSSPSNALITSAAFTTPGGGSTILDGDDEGNFEYEESFATKAELDAAFPSGAYEFSFHTTSNPANYSPTLILGADDYPTAPKLSNANWSGGKLAFDPSVDYTFNWNGIGNFTISLGTENNKVFTDFSVSSSTIPGGTLMAGQDYLAVIAFSQNGTSDGPTILSPGYRSFTHFTIRTAHGPDPALGFHIAGLVKTGADTWELLWPADVGTKYRIQTSTELTVESWVDVTGDIAAETSFVSREVINPTPTGPDRFWRVRMVP